MCGKVFLPFFCSFTMTTTTQWKKKDSTFILHQVFDFLFGSLYLGRRFEIHVMCMCSLGFGSYAVSLFVIFYLFIYKKEIAYANCDEEKMTWTSVKRKKINIAYNKIYNAHTAWAIRHRMMSQSNSGNQRGKKGTYLFAAYLWWWKIGTIDSAKKSHEITLFVDTTEGLKNRIWLLLEICDSIDVECHDHRNRITCSIRDANWFIRNVCTFLTFSFAVCSILFLFAIWKLSFSLHQRVNLWTLNWRFNTKIKVQARRIYLKYAAKYTNSNSHTLTLKFVCTSNNSKLIDWVCL